MPLHQSPQALTSIISMAAIGAGARLLGLPASWRSLLQLALFIQLLCTTSALNQDGILLLSFKLSLPFVLPKCFFFVWAGLRPGCIQPSSSFSYLLFFLQSVSLINFWF
jgi:hypothetical protein